MSASTMAQALLSGGEGSQSGLPQMDRARKR
jgi:hypothetical protein